MLRELIFPIALQLIGIGVIIAEFILPSGGLLTVLAAGCIGYSLFHVFRTISVEAGYFFVAADVVLIPVLIVVGIKMLANSPVTLRSALSRATGVNSQDASYMELVGKTGIAETSLRPAGKARIDGRRLDVVSQGDYIDSGEEIIVSSVSGNRIVVGKNLES